MLVFASLLLLLLETNSSLVFLAAARPFKLFRCVRKCVCVFILFGYSSVLGMLASAHSRVSVPICMYHISMPVLTI